MEGDLYSAKQKYLSNTEQKALGLSKQSCFCWNMLSENQHEMLT